MDGMNSSGGTGDAGIQPAGDLPGRQPLPGLPEDLAAATSLPMEGPLPSPPGNGPMQVPLPWPSPGHLACGPLCSLELSSHALCACTHHLHEQMLKIWQSRGRVLKTPFMRSWCGLTGTGGCSEAGGGAAEAAGAQSAEQPFRPGHGLCSAGRQPGVRHHVRLSLTVLWGAKACGYRSSEALKQVRLSATTGCVLMLMLHPLY